MRPLFVPLFSLAVLFAFASNSYSQPIEISVDVATPTNTPEGAVGAALLELCPKLDASETLDQNAQQLQDICHLILNADPATIGAALKAISAKAGTSETTVVTRTPATQQLAGISKRLAALRHGASGFSVSDLMLNIDGKPVSADQLAKAFTNTLRGGGAGDDTGIAASRLGGFVSGDFTFSTQDETANESGFDGNSQRLTAGMDYRFRESGFAGVAASFLKGAVDLNGKAGSLDAKDYGLTLYGTYYPSQSWYAEGTLNVGHQTFDLSRDINFTLSGTTISQTADSNTSGNAYGFSLGTGYEHAWQNGITGSLNSSLIYSKAKIDAYEENHAGGLNLAVNSQSIDSLIFSLGGQLSRAISTKRGVLLPQLSASWMHEFKQDGQLIRAHFTADPSKTPFSFTTPKRDTNYFTLAAGASFVFPGGRTVYIQYQTLRLLENYSQYMISLGGRMEF